MSCGAGRPGQGRIQPSGRADRRQIEQDQPVVAPVWGTGGVGSWKLDGTCGWKISCAATVAAAAKVPLLFVDARVTAKPPGNRENQKKFDATTPSGATRTVCA